MASLEEFCSITATLQFERVGKTPGGLRVDMPFAGTATSPHWEGELPVKGIDYVTFRGDGNMDLSIRGRIGEGKGVVSYRAMGVSIAVDQTTAEPQELLLFETANDDLAFLNSSIGVALGRGEGDQLALTVYLVRR